MPINILYESFAYQGGILDKKVPNVNNNLNSTNNGSKLTDGNLTTSVPVHVNGYYEWTLSNVSEINQYFLKANLKAELRFYDPDRNLLHVETNSSPNGYYATPEISNVKYVRIYNRHTTLNGIFEVDIYSKKLIGTGKPFDLKVSNITDSAAYLTWDSENSYFTIYRENGTVFATNILNMYYQFKNLQPATTYTFTMTRTDDNNAVSEHSDPITFTTLSYEEWENDPTNPDSPNHPDHPDNPNNNAKLPTNLRTQIGDKQVTVSWDYDGSVEGFYLYMDGQKVNNNMTASLMNYNEDYLITSKSYTVRGLENGQRYSFQVSAVNDAGEESEKSQVITAIPEPLTPSIPTELTVTNGDTLLNLRWRANPESNITGYNVYLNGVKVNSIPVTSTSYRIDSLENGTSYSVQVSALNSYGNESAMTQVVQGLPKESFIPSIPINSSYNLKDISDATSNWFGGLWLIVAFAVSIPLAFLIASRTKEMFLT